MDQNEMYLEIVESIMARVIGNSTKDKIDQLAKILNITEQSVYNKLKGRSRFTLEEIAIICRTFNISIDEIFNISNKDITFSPFHSDGLKYSPRAYFEYLKNINKYFYHIKKLSNVHGYFIANEVPLFHFLDFGHLMYLKLYIWNEINWHITKYGTEYAPETLYVDPEMNIESKNMKHLFNSFDSTEIWNPHMLDNTISQFNYLRQKGVVHKTSDIRMFKSELDQLIDKMEDLTLTGQKLPNANNQSYKCNIYLTELNVGSELIMVKSNDMDIMFQQLDIPNYMRTTDAKIINKLYEFFISIKKTSSFITGTGEMDRHRLFDTLKKKCSAIQ